MKKSTVKKLQKDLGMEIVRNEVTQQAVCLQIESENLIPELEPYANMEDPKTGRAVCTRTLLGDIYTYRIRLPKGWIDLCGDWH